MAICLNEIHKFNVLGYDHGLYEVTTGAETPQRLLDSSLNSNDRSPDQEKSLERSLKEARRQAKVIIITDAVIKSEELEHTEVVFDD